MSYTYFCTVRPAALYQVPDGFISSNPVYPPTSREFLGIVFRHFYGDVTYNEKLSFKKLDQYSMYPSENIEFLVYYFWDAYRERTCYQIGIFINEYLDTKNETFMITGMPILVRYLRDNSTLKEIAKIIKEGGER